MNEYTYSVVSIYGIEVCGIESLDEADTICQRLQDQYGYGSLSPRFRVEIESN